MMDIRDALFGELYELGKEDENVIILTADADAFALRKFKQEFPDRFYNMGVAEQNTILFATGLAMGGKKVFIYSIIPFVTMRCFEQIKVQVCSMNLPVTIVGLGAGLSFEFDGPTHHAMHDIGVMRMLPEMDIYNPSDPEMAQVSVTLAYLSEKPNYIRLDKGKYPDVPYKNFDGLRVVRPLTNVNVITTGTMLHRVLTATEGLNVGVVDVYRLKPIASNLISQIVEQGWTVVVEEHSRAGGLGDIVNGCAEDTSAVIHMALPHEQLLEYGTRDYLLEKHGLSVAHIRKQVEKLHGIL